MKLLKLALALAVGLGATGCGEFAALLGGGGGNLTATAAGGAGAEMASDALAAVGLDEDMDRGAAAAREAAFTTQALQGGPSGSLDATGSLEATRSLEASGSVGIRCCGGLGLRLERLGLAGKARFEEFKRLATILPPVRTTHADGTVTTRYELTVTRKNVTFHEVILETEAADGTVLAIAYDYDKTNSAGHKIAVHRERKLGADGSWSGVFQCTITRRDGKTKTVTWATAGAADGSEAATGKIVRFNGSSVTISITRTADGKLTVVTVDDRDKVSATAVKGEADADAEVRVKDRDGKDAGRTTVAGTADLEIGDR